MPEDKDGLEIIEEVTDPAPKKGKDTLQLEREQVRADEAQEKLVETLQGQVEAERSSRVWMTRIFIACFVLVLVMLGVSVGLVKTGTIGIPGIGTVEVGDVEVTIEQPDPSSASEEATAAPEAPSEVELLSPVEEPDDLDLHTGGFQ